MNRRTSANRCAGARTALALDAVEFQRIMLWRGQGQAGPGRLHVTAHQMQLVATHPAGQAMARHRHGRQDAPLVPGRIEGLHRFIGRQHAVVLEFAAGDDDVVVVSPQAMPLRGVGIGASAFQVSGAGSYAQALLIGTQPEPPPGGLVKPPKA